MRFNKKNLHSPHDGLFKHLMSDISLAKEFLTYHLPSKIKQAVDLNHLTLCQNSYVNKELALRMSDILYKTQIAGKESYIYLLVEHQSTVDPLMPFRVWQYILAIWSDHLKQTKNQRLPLVIPLVFYHGRNRIVLVVI